jgi:hypothetical protein
MANKIGFPKDCQKKKIGMKYAKTQAWSNLGIRYMSSYTATYDVFMECLANGETLNAEQLDFCDRYERMTEYFQPKLARKEIVGDPDRPLSIDLTSDQKDKIKKVFDNL